MEEELNKHPSYSVREVNADDSDTDRSSNTPPHTHKHTHKHKHKHNKHKHLSWSSADTDVEVDEQTPLVTQHTSTSTSTHPHHPHPHPPITPRPHPRHGPPSKDIHISHDPYTPGGPHQPASSTGEVPADDTIPHQFYLLLPAIIIGVFLGAADQTIVISSYAEIGTELNALDKVGWLGTAYLLPLSSLQLLYGTLSLSLGIKPLFLFAYAAFGLGCLLCGLAQSMNQLIVARAITGLAGGFCTLASIVLATYVPLRKRGVWQGWRNLVFAMGLGVGSAGGWVTEKVGWRWSFLAQVPLTAIGALNVLIFYPPPPPLHKTSLKAKLRHIDVTGALLIIAAVGTLLIAFDLGSNSSSNGWSSPYTLTTLLLSTFLFASFVYVEARVAKEPFCPKEVLTDRSLAGCIWCGFASYGAWFGVLYYLPLFWQAVEGVSPKVSSVRLLPGVATGVVGSLFAGWVIQRTGRYYTLVLTSYIAMTIGAVLLILFTGVVSTSLAATLISFFICGMGLNIGGTSSLVALMASAPPHLTPPALASLDLFRSLGAEVSLAICGAVIQGVLRSSLLTSLTSAPTHHHDSTGKGYNDREHILDIIDQVRRSLSSLQDMDAHTADLVRGAYAGAVTWVLGICAVFCALALGSCLFIREVGIDETAEKKGAGEGGDCEEQGRNYGACGGQEGGEDGGVPRRSQEVVGGAAGTGGIGGTVVGQMGCARGSTEIVGERGGRGEGMGGGDGWA